MLTVSSFLTVQHSQGTVGVVVKVGVLVKVGVGVGVEVSVGVGVGFVVHTVAVS
jgi:hypothetical protein